MITIVEKSNGHATLRTISIDTHPGLEVTIAQQAEKASGLRVMNVGDLARDETDQAQGDGEDALEALGEISRALACPNNLEDMLHAIFCLKYCKPEAAGARFVKLDAAGKPLPADAATFAAIQDNHTGLQWSGTLSEGPLDYAGAEKACQALDLAGHGDWRLPTPPQRASIRDHTPHKPAADPVFFGDTRTDDWYWTSTPCAWCSGASWCVAFYGGYVYDGAHGYRCFVRAVRSVVPAPGQ